MGEGGGGGRILLTWPKWIKVNERGEQLRDVSFDIKKPG